ncbi:MAG: hypothetical protein KC684_10220 [Candidatus Omnitrophica bacterium]|nr:hypothetical protein [Candidatus Omnitrophota bacterium]
MKKYFLHGIIIGCFCLGGCSPLEMVKTIWGSSTRALENARVDAITQSFECGIDECFDAVLALKRDDKTRVTYHRIKELEAQEDNLTDTEKVELEELYEKSVEGYFDVFLQNRVKSHIVVMGVDGNVDTTEVGIFFIPEGQSSVRIEVSSLSSSAKKTVADAVFAKLSEKFPVNDF